jgi:hypothetical protein
MIGKHGQNAFCLKRDVQELVQELRARHREKKVRSDIEQLMRDIEELKT